MSKLRLIFALILLPLAMFGCVVKAPAQSPTSIPKNYPAAGNPVLWIVKVPHAIMYLFH